MAGLQLGEYAIDEVGTIDQQQVGAFTGVCREGGVEQRCRFQAVGMCKALYEAAQGPFFCVGAGQEILIGIQHAAV